MLLEIACVFVTALLYDELGISDLVIETVVANRVGGILQPPRRLALLTAPFPSHAIQIRLEFFDLTLQLVLSLHDSVHGLDRTLAGLATHSFDLGLDTALLLRHALRAA